MSSLCDSEKLSFFFLQGKLNYDILLKMKFVSWAILGLTVDLRDILLQQSQWMPCCGDTCPLSRKPSCLKILLTPSSPHPEGTAAPPCSFPLCSCIFPAGACWAHSCAVINWQDCPSSSKGCRDFMWQRGERQTCCQLLLAISETLKLLGHCIAVLTM